MLGTLSVAKLSADESQIGTAIKRGSPLERELPWKLRTRRICFESSGSRPVLIPLTMFARVKTARLETAGPLFVFGLCSPDPCLLSRKGDQMHLGCCRGCGAGRLSRQWRNRGLGCHDLRTELACANAFVLWQVALQHRREGFRRPRDGFGTQHGGERALPVRIHH
jgi:hypothetical protein